MTITSENKNLEIICAGIIVSDIFLPPINQLPNEGELLRISEPSHQVGGCASNTAIALSRLGKKTGIIGMVGSDAIGDQLIRFLIQEKVNTNAVFKSSETSTSQTIIIPVKNQDRRYIHFFGTNSNISVEDIENGLTSYLSPNNLKVFVFGGYLLMPNIDSKELAKLFKKLKDSNCSVILDIAVSSDQIVEVDKIKDVLPFVDYFVPNEDEALQITGLEDVQAQAQCFIDWGAGAIAITCGMDGVYFKDRTSNYRIEPYKIDFVDGSGSGDAFTAGLAIGISESWAVVDALKFGSVLGASVCQGVGCNTTLFTREEAIDKMANIKVRSLV